MTYTLDQVIKTFKQAINKLEKDSIQRNYYEIIVKYLLLEHKHQKIVEDSNKAIFHYFKFSLPKIDREYFNWLYSPYNPVRFAVETFDSIEEIRVELKR